MKHSFQALSPARFLSRAAAVYGDRVAVVDGRDRFTYADLYRRARQLAGALIGLDLRPGDRVAVLSANRHEVLEAHYGVPFADGVLVTVNSRLGAAEIAHILRHSGAGILICSPSLGQLAEKAAAESRRDITVVHIGDEYERLLEQATLYEAVVSDELAAVAVNYTSGTTGAPKGVIYSHRGAYLQALAMAFHAGLTADSTYLWTLPMFHCNGWCFTWAVTAAAGTHVCLETVGKDAVWSEIEAHDVTHLCAAPTVLSMIAPGDEDPDHGHGRSIWVGVGGAPPAPAVLARARARGLRVTHLYGMTETYGPVVINEWQSRWDELPEEQRDRLAARQGVGNIVSEPVRVVNEAGIDIPADAVTLGEIALRGNNITPGYLNDSAATESAVPDGWLRTGDLAVRHPDGYIEIRDRAKDVIISGGENLTSVEIEQALLAHPAVAEAAVVARPDEQWGERPVAFIEPVGQTPVTADELRTHLLERIARFKVPDAFEFGRLPRTATGKVQKFALKQRLHAPHGGRPA
ncbi:AMP-binding protein [Prauserella endophytica]|uniref:Acyl-CoA synthetase n=1 Tax=Prauserella endophytica TaxID=1592324 RepID=A0ABY2SAU5_9PSEU|nr:AMP-binding protein [Prauserella endophytica]TKG72464.1 acyl-CoA synthetase [Prauserella endophytica]